jgi:hypothetical protein
MEADDASADVVGVYGDWCCVCPLALVGLGPWCLLADVECMPGGVWLREWSDLG